MSIVLDLEASERAAERRLASARRATPRLDPRVRDALLRELSGYDRPNLSAVRRRVAKQCQAWKIAPPSRTTLYQILEREVFHRYAVKDLPKHVRASLYNIDPDGVIGGHQLAFYCFNYGTLPALSFGASLPWVDLKQAYDLPGWRPKSHGLLGAVLKERG